MEDLANHMGLFLQKTNIIRDYLVGQQGVVWVFFSLAAVGAWGHPTCCTACAHSWHACSWHGLCGTSYMTPPHTCVLECPIQAPSGDDGPHVPSEAVQRCSDPGLCPALCAGPCALLGAWGWPLAAGMVNPLRKLRDASC